jgi:hypothetical protein
MIEAHLTYETPLIFYLKFVQKGVHHLQGF